MESRKVVKKLKFRHFSTPGETLALSSDDESKNTSSKLKPSRPQGSPTSKLLTTKTALITTGSEEGPSSKGVTTGLSSSFSSEAEESDEQEVVWLGKKGNVMCQPSYLTSKLDSDTKTTHHGKSSSTAEITPEPSTSSEVDDRIMNERVPLLASSEHVLYHSKSYKSREETHHKFLVESSWFQLGTFLRLIKAWLLFGLLVLCYIIFIIQPNGESSGHFIAVSNKTTFNIHLNSSGAPSNLFIGIAGGFLQIDPNIRTQNVSLFVSQAKYPTQPLSKKITFAVFNEETLYFAPPVRKPIEIQLPVINESSYLMTIQSTTSYPVPLSLHLILLTRYIYSQVVLCCFILLCMYVIILFDIMHRTLTVLAAVIAVCTILAFLNERPSLQALINWVDLENLSHLLGMMIIVAVVLDTGIFEKVAFLIFKICQGHTWPLITSLCLISGIMSALLDNVTTILILTPITFRICERTNLNPKHILIIEAIFSNIGGAATSFGAHSNVLIISNSDIISEGITSSTFTLHLFVGTVFVFTTAYLFLRYWYRKKILLQHTESKELRELRQEREIWNKMSNSLACCTNDEYLVYTLLQQKIETLNMLVEKQIYINKSTIEESQDLSLQPPKITKPWMLIKSAIILLITVVIYIFNDAGFLNLNLGWAAIFGVILFLILLDIRDIESVLHRVEWSTIILFGGLFIMMQGIKRMGLFSFTKDTCESIIQQITPNYRLMVAIIIILWTSALMSSVVNNIPYTMAMLPFISQISDNDDQNLPPFPLILALALGTCLGGNGGMLASSTNIVIAGLAEQHGYKISFIDFFKIGFPITILTTFVAMIYLLICHALIGWNQ